MSLTSAHAGYAYQDLLCTYFILKEVLAENDGTITIDQKQIKDDRFDDLIIRNKNGVYRKQIKYSESRTLTKDDLANDGKADLALHSLFNSWNQYPVKERKELHLCLAWRHPLEEDPVNIVLKKSHTIFSFPNYHTNVYSINLETLWEKTKEPLKSWQKFKREAKKIDRNEFKKFIQTLVIETDLPKASLNIYIPGQLETIVLELVESLGVGVYPNNHINKEETALALTELVKNSRALGRILYTKDILNHLRIRTDFGRIEQIFPVIDSKLVSTQPALKLVESHIEKCDKLIITGEPGAGKSWFINNLEKALDSKFIFIKHYCYTDLKDDLQAERIKINTLYGNLIAEIIERFPNLKENKQQKWASNLNELNILLSNVTEDIIILIDGLDHINRIFDLKRNVLKAEEVAIINAIDKINADSENIKFIILTQPISELEKFDNFERITLPKWSEQEVKDYLDVNQVEDITIKENLTLSLFLTEKSNGNPLYLSYLIDELLRNRSLGYKYLENLPVYSFNLSNYYEYLLTKINEGSEVPKILSGINFSLSKNEIIEITANGAYVVQDLKKLRPILNYNLSTGGYSIYHESFKRFIVEKLKDNNVSSKSNKL